jgi:hypothetical protein
MNDQPTSPSPTSPTPPRMTVRVICERCRRAGRPARLATYQSLARATRRVHDHCSATGHVADTIVKD